MVAEAGQKSAQEGEENDRIAPGEVGGGVKVYRLLAL